MWRAAAVLNCCVRESSSGVSCIVDWLNHDKEVGGEEDELAAPRERRTGTWTEEVSENQSLISVYDDVGKKIFFSLERLQFVSKELQIWGSEKLTSRPKIFNPVLSTSRVEPAEESERPGQLLNQRILRRRIAWAEMREALFRDLFDFKSKDRESGPERKRNIYEELYLLQRGVKPWLAVKW
ncbi:hypothetical protein JTB14_024393 [Gonioctena quinquepunctata]|nr:hypothetical protein JTB14_024393 [Gonioctena quinquepunctata]